MTVAASFWPRRFPRLPAAEDLLVTTEPGTRVLAHCHWQWEPARHPALVLVHGLEGSSQSGYMLGTAERGWKEGFSVVRMNQRNCGGTEHLTPTLYNSSLSGDVRAVVEQVIERKGVREVFAAGFSLGGNLVMKMAGEFGEKTPGELAALAAISPALDLAACAAELERPRNWIYEKYFLRRLKRRMRRKARLFPERYRLNGMESIRTIREFDDRITAPHSGFRDAGDYYHRASAFRVIESVARPALILAAEDDPLIPVNTLEAPAIRGNDNIQVVTSPRGGHCGFIAGESGGVRFWAEQTVVDFFLHHSRMGAHGSAGD
jgi:uncharacterized protein